MNALEEPGKLPPSLRLLRWFWATGVRAFLALYGHYEISGLENIPKTGAVICVANHSSNIDPLLAWSAVYRVRELHGIAKIELWNNPVVACFMNCMGSVSVNRGAADRAMLKTTFTLLEQGRAVGIFPEGTRSRDGRLQRAQPGLALIVRRSGAPVLPAAILGTKEMMSPGMSIPRPAKLRMVFGEPLLFAADTPKETILQATMEAIARLLTDAGEATESPYLRDEESCEV